MNPVRECYELTKALLAVVQTITTENREEQIKEIEHLLEKRDRLLNLIKPPFLDEEQQLGQAIVKMNGEIDPKLNTIRNLIQRDINGLNKKKTSAHKYNNPYESVNFDGMFYDKRN